MSDESDPRLRKMTRAELYKEIAGWKSESVGGIAGRDELARRNQTPVSRRAWIAIGISVAALIISLIAIVK